MVCQNVVTGEFARQNELITGLWNDGIKELDLALYSFESPNSNQEHPRAAMLKTLLYVLLFQ
jgi:hypothetical protein